jgi:hypothetical protein
MVTTKMIAAAELMMAGKINPRMAKNYVGQLSKAAENAHKASVHTRYDKEVKRVQFFDKNITTRNQVNVINPDTGKVLQEKDSMVIFTPKQRKAA